MLPTKDQALAVLARHIGSGNGITAAALAEALHTMPRQVRALITELRLDSVAVCGTPKTGYYIAATADELETTCQFLRGRALHSLTLESRLRKLPLADLVGQLHLAT